MPAKIARRDTHNPKYTYIFNVDIDTIHNRMQTPWLASSKLRLSHVHLSIRTKRRQFRSSALWMRWSNTAYLTHVHCQSMIASMSTMKHFYHRKRKLSTIYETYESHVMSYPNWISAESTETIEILSQFAHQFRLWTLGIRFSQFNAYVYLDNMSITDWVTLDAAQLLYIAWANLAKQRACCEWTSNIHTD